MVDEQSRGIPGHSFGFKPVRLAGDLDSVIRVGEVNLRNILRRRDRPGDDYRSGGGWLKVRSGVCVTPELHYFLFVGRTMTVPPFGPGTAPRTSIRFSSGMSFTTTRLRTVT